MRSEVGDDGDATDTRQYTNCLAKDAFLLCGPVRALSEAHLGYRVEAFRWFERHRASAAPPECWPKNTTWRSASCAATSRRHSSTPCCWNRRFALQAEELNPSYASSHSGYIPPVTWTVSVPALMGGLRPPTKMRRDRRCPVTRTAAERKES